MSTENVIEVDGLGKRYKLGVIGGATLADDLKVAWAKLRGKPNPLIPLEEIGNEQRTGDYFWALKNIDFTVPKGQILGIIGHNGAGKSTLLKLLSRITLPTEGEVRMKGRSSSLLEVGTGFNPELTGRENIFLNGAILGMTRAEIQGKLEEIIAFSGIKHHIDTPTKRYSSGMKVRLGFAVAAHLEPEILIIDEVLAVGDADFQRKCMGKMKDVASSGRTILFVSHNMLSVKSLCDRVVWIHAGGIREDGDTETVVRNYLKTYSSESNLRTWQGEERPNKLGVYLNRVQVRSKEELLVWTKPFEIEIEYENTSPELSRFNIGIHLYSGDDVLVFASSLRERDTEKNEPFQGIQTVSCEIPGELLNAGEYRVVVNFFLNGKFSFRQENTIGFVIHEEKRAGSWFNKKKGVIRPSLQWRVHS